MFRSLHTITSHPRSSPALLRSPQWVCSVQHRSTAVLSDQIDLKNAKPYEQMPGPKPLPIIGNAWRFMPFIGHINILDTVGSHRYLFGTYGNIVRISGIPGRPDIVLTQSPSDLQTMYQHEGPWPNRPGNEAWKLYYEKFRSEVTGGRSPTLASQGEAWQKLRSAVQQPIMQPKTARMYIGSVEQVTNEFIQRMRSMRDNKNEMPADFRNELYKWSLESIALIALDTRLGCLSPNLSPDSEPQKMIDSVQDIFHTFAKLESGIPFWKYYSTPTWNKFKKAMDTFTEIAYKYIQKAVDSLKTRSMESEDDLTLLQRLLKRDPDPRTALLVAFDLLFAGIDTTSLSVSSLLFLLAKNPDKQQKLYEEIRQFLPTSSTPVTSEIMNDMRYLRACMKEALRIAPVASGNFRVIASDAVLSGYRVPKGTFVINSGVIMSNKDENFPMATKFIPERWLKGDDTDCPFAKEKVHPFASLPFSHGPRSCIGRRFAEMEIQMLTAKVIQNFEVEFNYDRYFSTEDSILYSLPGPLKFTMKDRK